MSDDDMMYDEDYDDNTGFEDNGENADESESYLQDCSYRLPRVYLFNMLKKSIKSAFASGDIKQMTKNYNKLLVSLRGGVVSTDSERIVNSLLDRFSMSSSLPLVLHLFEITLNSLQHPVNHRIFIRVAFKYAKILQEKAEFDKLAKVLEDMHKMCDTGKVYTHTLFELCCAEMQMHMSLKHVGTVKELFDKAVALTAIVAVFPRWTGLINECRGKVSMYEEDWHEASKYFRVAFDNFDEAGSPRRIACLKYRLFADMRANSCDALPPYYKNDPEVVAMSKLLSAPDLQSFETNLELHKKHLLDDFLDPFIEQLHNDYRAAALANNQTQPAVNEASITASEQSVQD